MATYLPYMATWPRFDRVLQLYANLWPRMFQKLNQLAHKHLSFSLERDLNGVLGYFIPIRISKSYAFSSKSYGLGCSLAYFIVAWPVAQKRPIKKI